VLPGTTYLVTRRCSERRFFLRPDPEVTRIFEYLLGLLAKKHAIEVHAYTVMSNHYHLVITDAEGRLPDFQRELNSLLARAINAHRGRWESLWDRESYSAVALLEEGDVLSKMAYTLANPVAARLVNRARQWEGATSVGMRFGRARTVERPRGFFGEEMPEAVELEVVRPRCCRTLSDEELRGVIEEELGQRERRYLGRGKAMGMGRVMRQDWNASPGSSAPRRGMRPTIAGANKWARIEALQRSAEWLCAYKEALRRFVSGQRDVEFPKGSWWMGVRLGCVVAVDQRQLFFPIGDDYFCRCETCAPAFGDLSRGVVVVG
jgi:putative transposase